jgi:hypothetical protein
MRSIRENNYYQSYSSTPIWLLNWIATITGGYRDKRLESFRETVKESLFLPMHDLYHGLGHKKGTLKQRSNLSKTEDWFEKIPKNGR